VIVTVCAGEVLVMKLVSPSYLAVIAFEPTGRVVVVSAAVPALPSVAVPSEVVPLKNSTVPVGVPVPGLVAVTVAVREIEAPVLPDEGDAVSAVVVLACATVTVVAVEVLPVKLRSPWYTAVIEFEPSGSAGVERVAMPPLPTLAVPRLIVPLMNATVPVGGVVSLASAEVTVAVKATSWPWTTEVGLAETEVVLPTWLVRTTSWPVPPV
jgi:hypothetical protein